MHTYFRLSKVRCVILADELNLAFDCCRCEYIKLLHREDSIWESFPKALERQDGTRRYISTFRAPFQEPPLNPKEVHVLWACSLLVIPSPPPGSEALPGSFPDDLSEVNLSDWADTVQDVVAGLLALPQGLSSCLLPEVVNLLLRLEQSLKWGFVTIATYQKQVVDVWEQLVFLLKTFQITCHF